MLGFLVVITDRISVGDLIILGSAAGYALYVWRVGVPRVLRDQNRDLRERNDTLEKENRTYSEANAELRARVVVLESRVGELEAKGTEQIYQLLSTHATEFRESMDQLSGAVRELIVLVSENQATA